MLNPRLICAVIGQASPAPGLRLVWSSERAKTAATAILARGWQRLLPRERAVLEARFGDGLTLTETGALLGYTRERVRQVGAKALRKLRRFAVGKQDLLKSMTKVVVIPDGLLDPTWLSTDQAEHHTDLSYLHLLYLARTGRVKSRRRPGGRRVQIHKTSLRDYVKTPATHCRKKATWRE